MTADRSSFSHPQTTLSEVRRLNAAANGQHAVWKLEGVGRASSRSVMLHTPAHLVHGQAVDGGCWHLLELCCWVQVQCVRICMYGSDPEMEPAVHCCLHGVFMCRASGHLLCAGEPMPVQLLGIMQCSGAGSPSICILIHRCGVCRSGHTLQKVPCYSNIRVP